MLEIVEGQPSLAGIPENQGESAFGERYSVYHQAGGILSPDVCSKVWETCNDVRTTKVKVSKNEKAQALNMARIIEWALTPNVLNAYATLSQIQLKAIQQEQASSIVSLSQQVLFDQALLLEGESEKSKLFRNKFPQIFKNPNTG